MKKNFLTLLVLGLLIVSGTDTAFAQAPNITYTTNKPTPYPIGTAISTLTPTNTGGATTSGFYSFTTFVNLTSNAYGVATDAYSNVYTGDYSASVLYKYNSSGVGGPLTITGGTLSNPSYMTIDASNNLYITNFTSKTVLKMSSTGTVLATINGFTNDPYGVITDASNNLYIVDVNTGTGTGVIRKVAAGATGTVTGTTIISGITGTPLGLTIVGNDLYVSLYSSNTVVKYANAVTGGTTQTPFASGFSGPRNLSSDASGNVYVADYGNNRIQEIPPTGGTGTTVISGLSSPRDLTFDVSGNLYVSNGTANDIIRSIPGNYSISPVLPTGLSFNTTTGAISGTPTATSSPTVYTIVGGNSSGTSSTTVTLSVIAAAPSISYSQSNYTFGFSSAVSLVPTNSGGSIPATTYGTVSLFAGNAGGTAGTGNGTGTAAGFKGPTGITVDNTGTIYVADKTNDAIRAITSGAAVTTFAGTIGTAGLSNTGTGTFNLPSDITNDWAGNLYVADFNNNEVRKITAAPAVSLLAGSATGASGSTNSPALFHSPSGAAYDATTGAVYIADQANALIRKVIVSSGVTSTFGTGITYTTPTNVAVDASGNVYVTDKGLNKIIKITSGGTASVFAGSGTASSVDGTGTAATFNAPDGITIDKAGNIYVSEGTGNKIRMITTPGAVVTTIAGSGATGRNNAVGTAATFNAPAGLDVDPTTGNIFVADVSNNEIREIIGTGYSISPTTLPTGLTFDPTTGTISGTTSASVTSGPTTYTITGFNAAGSSVATVTITVALAAPAISYATSPVSLKVGVAMGTAPNTNITVTNTGGAVSTTFGYSSTAATAFSVAASDPLHGGAIDAAGNIYILNFISNTISEFTSSGTLITSSYGSGAPALGHPAGMVFDSGGNCWVLNASTTSSGTLYKYNSSGVYQSAITISGAATTFGLAIDASDNLYVTNYNGSSTNQIIKITSGGTQSTFINSTGLNQPIDIGLDASGNVYVVNYAGATAGAGYISVYNSAGTLQTQTFATNYSSPFALKVDAVNGYVYAADNANNNIYVYATGTSSNATKLATISSVGDCRGLILNMKGNIYAPDFTTGVIYEYSPTGYFFLSKALPTTLTLSKTAGSITSGTPAAPSAATNYTVTAWNSAGGGSAILNITCYNTSQWKGGTAGNTTTWGIAGNWTGGVPGAGDQAQIGVTNGAIAAMPIIPAGTTISVGSIVMGTLATGTVTTPSITVNGTGQLNVSGDITFESNNTMTATTSPAASLNGTGTVTANNLNVTLAPATSTGIYNETLSSSVTTLTLSGNVNLVSTNTGNGTKYQNAIFNLTGGTLTTNGFTSTNAVAGNTSTFGISTGTTLNFTGTAAFSGLSSTGTNSITGLSGTGVTIGYTGSNAQTVYSDAAITNSTLSNGLSYSNLAFSGTTGIKTALSGNINVTGSFTNSMTSDATTTYVDFSSPTVNFNGTSAQALAGGAGVGTTFYNVTFSGNSTKTLSGLFNIASTGTLSMNGTSSANILNAGTGVLTLKSDASSSATVAAIGNSQSITGSVNVQRFITGGAGMRGYRLMSSPVYGGSANSNNVYSINYIASSCYVTGTTVSTPGPGIDKTGNPTLYLFRENLTPSQLAFTAGNFRGVGNMGTTGLSNITYGIDVDGTGFNIPVGNGFLFFFRGDRSVQPIATETVPTYVPTNTVLTSTGTLNQGSIVVHDWYTPTSGNLGWTNTTTPAPGNAAVQGYNLVGNPYASAISWTAVYAASSNVGVSTYQFNPATNQYSAYIEGAASGTGGSGDVIGSGQGFFVIASNASAILNFSEAEKVTSQPSTLLFAGKRSLAAANSQQYLHLKMVTDSVNYDDVIIAFKPTASAKYSVNEDAIHLKGNSPPETLTALSSDSVGLSINYLPLQGKQTVVGLNANATASGSFTFLRTELVGIPVLYNIWLKDNLMKDSLDLRANSTYQFSIDNTNPASYGPNRFQLVFSQNPALALHLLNFVGAKVANAQQAQLTWTVENESNYTTFNVQRSTDGGKTWSIIGTLQSNNSGTYNYVDNNPVIGQDLYRLQLVDLDGGITYSQVITINFIVFGNNGANALSVYPNPAHDLINISINTAGSANAYSIVFTSNTGSVVKRVESASASSQQDISALVPGIYYISMIDNGTKSVIAKSKFVKL